MIFINIIKIITLPLFFLVSIISKIFPKDKNLWVFGAWDGQRYSDNSRYLFEFVCGNEPDIRAVWFTKNKRILQQINEEGQEVCPAYSLRGIWTALRAGMVFVSSGMPDVNPPGCYGALKIQLWHGIPLKKIGLDDKISVNPDLNSLYNILKFLWVKSEFFKFPRYDMVISSSPEISERLSTAFGIKKEKVIVTGYPRNDIILSRNPLPVPIIEDLKKKWDATRVILFAPTFRINGTGDSLFGTMDLDRFNKMLVHNRAVFLIKMHYVQRLQKVLSDNVIKDHRIHLITEEEEPDINFLLPHIDVLVTDYSSVYFDFLLLDRPVIFTPFDIEQYNNIDREFYEDYNLATPGPKCRNWDEVIEILGDVFKGKDMCGQLRREKRSIYHTYVDSNSCERIVKDIKSRFIGLDR